MQVHCTRPHCQRPENHFADLDDIQTLKTVQQILNLPILCAVMMVSYFCWTSVQLN
jgi:hypothetical protein